jgi:hypothetical protein
MIGRYLPGRKFVGWSRTTQLVYCLVVVGKKHLWPLAFAGENSIVAAQ